jgi:protein-tyrosine phosphatase
LIDIHSHVLPGIDDGSPDEATSIKLCEYASEHGTTDLVATPHNNLRYPYDPANVRRLIDDLQAKIGDKLFLHKGCDMHLTSDNIKAALAEPAKFTINGHQYLLVEFSDELMLQGTAQIFSDLRENGIVPVISHPERNPHLRKVLHRLRTWVERGCLLQITAGSVLGHFGERSQRAAIQMMDASLVHFFASDGHNLTGRPPRVDEAYDFVAYRWGDDVAERVFIDNPWAAIWGQEIEPPKPRIKRRGKKKFFLFR